MSRSHTARALSPKARLRALEAAFARFADPVRRAFRTLWAAPPAVRLLAVAIGILALWGAANWIVQAVRKPSEMFFPVGGALVKTPPETWRQYGPLFREHSTAVIAPELLAALAQIEGAGNPVARPRWTWRPSWNPFELYRPSSSAVGMFQITDAAFRYEDPGSQKVYAPQNYDGTYHGICQLQVCIGNSFNIPAVKVELGVGVPNVVDTARAMGAGPWQQHAGGSFTNDDGSQDFGPSLTLGGYGETPLQMATGASVLAAQGMLHQPFAITRVDQADKALFEHQDSAKQVIDPKVAFIMSAMLSRDSNRAEVFGQNSLLTIPGWQVAVKTGTSDSFADAWTVGYTPKIAVAVWMGNPDWRIKMLEGSDSYYVAVPAWHEFLAGALPVLGTETWYTVPDGIVEAWDNYYLPGTQPDASPYVEPSPSPTPATGHRHRKKKH